MRFGSAGEPLRWYISQPAKCGPLTSQCLRRPSEVRMNAPFFVPTNTRSLLMVPSYFDLCLVFLCFSLPVVSHLFSSLSFNVLPGQTHLNFNILRLPARRHSCLRTSVVFCPQTKFPSGGEKQDAVKLCSTMRHFPFFDFPGEGEKSEMLYSTSPNPRGRDGLEWWSGGVMGLDRNAGDRSPPAFQHSTILFSFNMRTSY